MRKAIAIHLSFACPWKSKANMHTSNPRDLTQLAALHHLALQCAHGLSAASEKLETYKCRASGHTATRYAVVPDARL